MNRSIIVVAVMLAGCASPAVFRDPKTGQSGSMQCNDAWNFSDHRSTRD
ncbi:hypothetical protein [Paraburkholderia fungorum]